MSVTNYTPDKCKYSIGKLVKSVWLVSEEAIKDIRIDNGEAWVESVSETPIRLDCYSIELTDTDTLDERYKFTHTLTFSVNGYANKDDFQGRYYAIVKDDEGTYWLVNPLFPCKVTYTYTLGNEQNHTDFTMSTASNHPVLKLNGMVDSSTYECNEYWLDGIDALWLNEKRYTVHSGNHVMYTNGGFKTVEYNSKSATFTETFDGTNTSHGIEFDVLFSEYKKSWHYNLLEFKDNLYASVIKTRNNKYALCGFSLGMQPGFQVSANDTNNQIDRIHITLNDAHDAGDTIEMYDSIEYEYLSAKTWVYTDEYDGWECVDEGVARYLLQMEVDALENETGNYKVLDGYSSRFPYLNIVDTFDNTETFENVDCGSSSCRLRSSFPSQLTFNDTGCQTYYVKADSDWEIDSSVDYIRVSPSTGSAGESYIVSVCNDIEPSDTVRNSSLTIEYCNTSSTVDVSVAQYEGCFTQGSTYNIPANAKVMTLPSDCCINNAREVTSVGVSIIVYQNYLQVTVPENNTGVHRTIILLITYCDGTTENIVISQDNMFEKWVDDHEECVGRSKYMVQYKYVGTSPDHCDTRTEETRYVLIEVQSDECTYEYRWALSDTMECDGYDEYYLYTKQVRVIDSSDPWENVNPPEYSIDGNGTMQPVIYKKKSTICGWVNYAMYRWIDTDEGSCFEVKECEDYPQLSVPVCISDNTVVENKVSSVYNVSTSTTGRVYSNVGEILIGDDLSFDSQTNEVADANTGLTIGNDVVSNYYTKNVTGRTVVTGSRYQTLVGCGIKNMIVYESKIDGNGTQYYSVPSFVCLLKDTPLDSYNFVAFSASERVKIYVQDWAVNTLRCAYTPTKTNQHYTSESKHPIVLPISDLPVPIVLTEYSAETIGYECCDVNKCAIVDVKDQNGVVIGSGTTVYERYSEDCVGGLTFEVISGGTITFTKANSNNYGNVAYSRDGGESWVSGGTASTISVSVSAGDYLVWKASGLVPTVGIGKFISNGRYNVFGDITSMFDRYSYEYSLEGMFSGSSGVVSAEHLIIPSERIGNTSCEKMFANCASLTKAPQNLPATTLGNYSYSAMFSGCTSLTTPPQSLPATTLGNYCYNSMFDGCTSLMTAPVISATTMPYYGCYQMFRNCTSLTAAPVLSATTLGDSCYMGMFQNCTSLTTLPNNMLPATTMAQSCYYGMFAGCTSLTTLPSGLLPATALVSTCYNGMFAGCTSLVTVPNELLPATTMVQFGCYYGMFADCTSLTTAPNLPATTLEQQCYRAMFSGCTSLTTPPTLPATTLALGCYEEMFIGCTSLTTGPVLSATTLVSQCYRDMFSGCTALNSITCLATNPSSSYTYRWVKGVASNGTFYKNPNISSWSTGNDGIPSNWVVQDYS